MILDCFLTKVFSGSTADKSRHRWLWKGRGRWRVKILPYFCVGLLQGKHPPWLLAVTESVPKSCHFSEPVPLPLGCYPNCAPWFSSLYIRAVCQTMKEKVRFFLIKPAHSFIDLNWHRNQVSNGSIDKPACLIIIWFFVWIWFWFVKLNKNENKY